MRKSLERVPAENRWAIATQATTGGVMATNRAMNRGLSHGHLALSEQHWTRPERIGWERLLNPAQWGVD
jgi:acyl-CoA synthetase (NDP forming)